MKQEKFAQLLVYLTLPASRAYVEAGYKASTPNVAEVEASKLLRKPKVQARIKELSDQSLKELSHVRNKIIAELMKIAFFQIDSIVDNWGPGGEAVEYKPLKDVDPSLIKSVQERRTKEGVSYIDIVPHDKLKALEMLSKYFGMDLTPKDKENTVNNFLTLIKNTQVDANIQITDPAGASKSYQQLLRGIQQGE